MQVKDGAVPQFYKDYVKNVHEIIEKNAEFEFECIWREHRRTKKPNSLLSDEVSHAIVKLKEELQGTSLWDNEPLRRVVLTKAFPKLLLDKLGLDILMERIPESYTRAIFGSYLASRFCYKYGIEPSQFAFLEFMTPLFNEATALQAK
jgi:glutamate dehydrogenase